MSTVQLTNMTVDEFFEWAQRPENREKKVELERGVPVEMPPPGELHGVICLLIARLLSNYVFDRGKGFACSNDTGLLVEESPDTLRGPDVMVFDEQVQMGDLSPKYSTRIPKLIVEVLSPSDSYSQTTRRVSQYLQRGVPLVWAVDPVVRTVTVHHSGSDLVVLDEKDDLTNEAVLPGFRHTVADLFKLPGDAE